MQKIKDILFNFLFKIIIFIHVRSIHSYYKQLKKLKSILGGLVKINYKKVTLDEDEQFKIFLNVLSGYMLDISLLPNDIDKEMRSEIEIIRKELSNDGDFISLMGLRYQFEYYYRCGLIDAYNLLNSEKKERQEEIKRKVALCKAKQYGIRDISFSYKEVRSSNKRLKKLYSKIESKILLETINNESVKVDSFSRFSSSVLSFMLVLLVIASVFYEWFFFYKLNFSLSNVNYVFEDLINSVISWSTILIPGVITFIAYYLLMSLFSGGKSSYEMMVMYGRYSRWLFFKTLYPLPFFLLIFYVSYLFYFHGNIDDSIYRLATCLTISWVLFVQMVYFSGKMRRIPLYVNYIVSYSPVLCLYFLSLGYFSAELVLNNHNDSMSAFIRINGKSEQVTIIRMLSNGYYMLNSNKKLIFVPSKNIDRVEFIK